MRRVRVGITVGDPAGIGPEIVEKARADRRVTDVCAPVVFAPDSLEGIRPGEETAAAGRAAYDTVVRATEAALAGHFGGDRARDAFAAVDRALFALERNAGAKVVAEWLALQL